MVTGCGDLGAKEFGIDHLTGDGAGVDELVEFLLLGCGSGGSNQDVRRTYCLMGLLSVLAVGLVVAGMEERCAVARRDEITDGECGVLAQSDAVGAHVGDMALFVELLREAHRDGRSIAQTRAGSLLERRCGERRVRGAFGRGLLDVVDVPGASASESDDAFDIGTHRLSIGAGPRSSRVSECDRLLLGGSEEAGVEEEEVRDETRDLTFPFGEDAEGRRLDTASRETVAEFLPDQSGEVVANEAVEDASRLLGLTEVLVDGARVEDGLLHRLRGDLVEGDPPGFLDLAGFGDVPSDRLTFAVGVGREVDLVGLGGEFPEFRHDRMFIGGDLVVRFEAVLYINRLFVALGEVADVADGGDDLVLVLQVFGYGLGLGGRLDDEEFHRECFLAAPYIMHGTGVFGQPLDLEHGQGGREPSGLKCSHLGEFVNMARCGIEVSQEELFVRWEIEERGYRPMDRPLF